MSVIIGFCSCHIDAAPVDGDVRMKSEDHQSGVHDIHNEVPKYEKSHSEIEAKLNRDKKNEDESLKSHDKKDELNVTKPIDLSDFSEQEVGVVDLGKDAVQDKALMQKMYEYVKSIFDQIGIALKDVMSSWSKMSSKQVNKLASDIDAITTSMSRFVGPKAEGDVF